MSNPIEQMRRDGKVLVEQNDRTFGKEHDVRFPSGLVADEITEWRVGGDQKAQECKTGELSMPKKKSWFLERVLSLWCSWNCRVFLAKQVAFIIDRNGNIVGIFSKVDVKKHFQEVLEALGKLR